MYMQNARGRLIQRVASGDGSRVTRLQNRGAGDGGDAREGAAHVAWTSKEQRTSGRRQGRRRSQSVCACALLLCFLTSQRFAHESSIAESEAVDGVGSNGEGRQHLLHDRRQEGHVIHVLISTWTHTQSIQETTEKTHVSRGDHSRSWGRRPARPCNRTDSTFPRSSSFRGWMWNPVDRLR